MEVLRGLRRPAADAAGAAPGEREAHREREEPESHSYHLQRPGGESSLAM